MSIAGHRRATPTPTSLRPAAEQFGKHAYRVAGARAPQAFRSRAGSKRSPAVRVLAVGIVLTIPVVLTGQWRLQTMADWVA